MMESQNLGADGQFSDSSQPIRDASKTVGGGVDAVADKAELGSGGIGEVVKRKRGRPPKGLAKPPQPKPPPAKKIKEEKEKEKAMEDEEDVCFICFDGGSLVLCDRRGCPKAYHPACIKRDEAFFESAAKWNCGWHICSICQKTAHHMCYTCTYSLCRGCIRKADYVCVRGDKGFCTVCMKTIMLIENNGQGEDGKVQADFDDKLSWEYLFKVYWVYLKGKLSLTLNELTEAKNPWKVATEISSVLPSTDVVLPSTDVHHRPTDLTSIIPATSIDNSEANESKRRKIDEQINMQKETVNMENPKKDESTSMEWATKELLEFVAHMKNGSTSVLSRFDVQALMMEYINRNNLRDPKRKNQIICDSRLKSLFGKPRVGHIQMLKLLENHFLVKEELQKKRVNRTVVNRSGVTRTAVQVDPDWNSDNMPTVGKDKKRKSCSKGVERVLQNKLDEFAAVDIHNINLVYLRRDLMENLLDDSDSFHSMVVGSIVRIKISGCDLKHDMYRLVQVVGTSKVDVPYKINSKLTDVMLEVLNLDKKETISIDAVSDQEFSEEECRRLQRSIRCGLVEHFTVGQIQEKAVALQSIKLNDWIEKEILRLNHLRDIASEKGHKKGYRECVEKLQLLKTPEERERRLNEVPEVHSDPKMNPDYESDDTEEYFNKEHGDHMESKYSGISSKTSRSPKRRSRKDEKPMNQSAEKPMNKSAEKPMNKSAEKPMNQSAEKPMNQSAEKPMNQSVEKPMNQSVEKPMNQSVEKPMDESVENLMNQSVTTSPIVDEESTKPLSGGIDLEKDASEKDASASTLERSQHEIDCNGSTVTKLEPQATLSTSVSNSAPETIASKIISVPSDILWHYLDPNGKVQGPFSLVQLQRWSTTGYFPTDMRIWTNHKDNSLLLNDVLKKHFNNYENVSANVTTTATSTVATAAASKQIEGLNVCSEIPSSIVAVTQNSVNNDKLSDSQLGQNWSGNNNNLNYNPPSVESTVQLETSNMTQETEKNEADIKHAPVTTLVDLPGPTPKEMQSVFDSKPLVQDSGNPPSWSTTASSLVVGEPKLPVSGNGWGGGCSSTPVKHEEWDSGIVLEVAGDHAATPTSNIDQNVNLSQPTCNDFTWHGMGEMIEFSTLAEESVSDLLAEVDAMESQYGLPSPTSRRNSFVDDLFNGSFDEFSPTPDQGTRSDGFSSSGDIQLPCQSTTTTTPEEHPNIDAFDFMKTSNGLQQHSFVGPEISGQTQNVGVSQRTNSENMGLKWPEMERTYLGMIDINRSAKAEGDEGEMETKTSEVKMENMNYNIHQSMAMVDNGIVQNLETSGEMKSGEHVKEMQVPKTIGIGAKLVTRVAQIKGLESTTNHRRGSGVPAKEEEDGEFIPPQPLPPPRAPPLTLGLDPYDPCDLGSETFQDKFSKPSQGTNMVRVGNIGWDSNQRKYGSGERYNSSSSSSPRERSHQFEESGYSRSSRSSWNKQPSLGSGSGSGGGGYSKPPPSKGQRVCRFYESGRCKKGALCKYLHPSP